jgi:hypothetical protein
VILKRIRHRIRTGFGRNEYPVFLKDVRSVSETAGTGGTAGYMCRGFNVTRIRYVPERLRRRWPITDFLEWSPWVDAEQSIIKVVARRLK